MKKFYFILEKVPEIELIIKIETLSTTGSPTKKAVFLKFGLMDC